MTLKDSLVNSGNAIIDAIRNPTLQAGMNAMGIPTATLPKKGRDIYTSKPTVNKTLVVPDIEENQTLIDQETGYAQGYGSGAPLSDFDLAALAMAGRRKPKNAPDSDLERALKNRENFGYSLAKALSGIPQQQGYGTWLTDFGRSFGSSYIVPTDSWIDREKTMAKEARENEKVFGQDASNDMLMYLLLKDK